MQNTLVFVSFFLFIPHINQLQKKEFSTNYPLFLRKIEHKKAFNPSILWVAEKKALNLQHER